jgi:Ala-tRNA(Pro) deacylase
MLKARTQAMLDRQHVPYEVIRHQQTFTAHGTAAVSHIPGRQFAKVVVVQAKPGHPKMVVLPANCHLDFEAFADVAGEGPVALVPEPELARLFPDCEVGAMPPFGNEYGIPVFVSRCLASSEEVYFNAGSHREAIGLRYEDFMRLAQPVVASICRVH